MEKKVDRREELEAWKQAAELAKILAQSDMLPKNLMGKPANVLLVLMFGWGLGLDVGQSLRSIGCVDGRPFVYGDAVLGLVMRTGLLEDFEETLVEDGKGGWVATCRVKRKGWRWVTATFSSEDVKRAGLGAVHNKYPQRMLKFRARVALRDAFPDVLSGLGFREIAALELIEGQAETAPPVMVPADSPVAEKPTGAPPALQEPMPAWADPGFTTSTEASQQVAVEAAKRAIESLRGGVIVDGAVVDEG